MPQHHRLDFNEIYYGVEGERHGPVDLERIRLLIEHGNFRADDYVWLPAEEQWVEAAEIPEIAELFAIEQLQNVARPYRQEDELPYAGFWIRLAAHLIDGVVLFLPSLLWFTMALTISGIDPAMIDTERLLLDPWSSSNSEAMEGMLRFEILAWGGFWIIEWIYRAALESSPWQATIGKRVLGLSVTDQDGLRLSFARAALRHIAKIASQIPFNFGFLMIAFHERKQGLHDLIARTLVVRR